MIQPSELGIHLKNCSAQDLDALLPPDVVLLGYRGSIAHGMYIAPEEPTSIDDKNLLGVCIGPVASYFGLQRFEQKEVMLREWDVVTYEYRKFVRLLCQGNPNVLSLLWLEPNHYIFRTELGYLLCDQRELFVTKRVYHAFKGYACSVLKRMTHLAFEGRMGAKRKALFEKFGYDAKSAAHLIRLLRMGIEFLREGRLHVLRPDAAQLLEIKRGEWSLDQVKAEAEHLFKRADAAYDACTFPAQVDEKKINHLLVEVLSEALAWRMRDDQQ